MSETGEHICGGQVSYLYGDEGMVTVHCQRCGLVATAAGQKKALAQLRQKAELYNSEVSAEAGP